MDILLPHCGKDDMMTTEDQEYKLQMLDRVMAEANYTLLLWNLELPARPMREFISKSLIEREMGVRESEATIIVRYQLRYGENF